MANINEKIVNFSFISHLGKSYQLSDFLGKKVVFYYYYQNDDGWSLKQALDYKAFYEEFESLNTVIIGVSINTNKSNQAFALKHQLPFILVSDENIEIAKIFDAFATREVLNVKRKMVVRSTFLINETGKLEKEWKPTIANNDADVVINYIKESKVRKEEVI